MVREEKLRLKLLEIAQITAQKYKDHDDNLGIFTGISGIALFQFYYAKHLDSDYHADIGMQMITHCIEKINAGYSIPSYCNGIAGLGWVIQHLNSEEFIEVDCDNLLGQFDGFLYENMIKDFKKGDYDFLHGGLGYGFYFFKRFKHTRSPELKEKYRNILFKCVAELKRLAIIDNGMAKWPYTLGQEENMVSYNLGAAHGIASILNFLSRLHDFEAFKKCTGLLLKLGTNYLLDIHNRSKSDISFFPNAIIDENSNKYNSRLAWCHGDLGIGMSMVHVAGALNNTSLKNTWLPILQHSTNRRKQKDTMVVDAGFCHGSYGNAQIYHAINYHYPNDFFKEALNFWIDDGLKKATYPDGYAGYKQMAGLEGKMHPLLSVLEGVSGIGLVTIDYLSSNRNTWDECFMIGK